MAQKQNQPSRAFFSAYSASLRLCVYCEVNAKAQRDAETCAFYIVVTTRCTF
jgi:hypothetical protein